MQDREVPDRLSPDIGHILLVDDNAHNLAAIDAALSTLGQNVVKATSGGEALRALLRHDFAVILLDVKMPGLDGFETARFIRSRLRSRYTPIIFITAYDELEREILRGYSLGAVDFLFKPFVPEILRSKVAALIDLDRQSRLVKRQSALLREAEKREHARELLESKRQWEAQALRQEIERERAAAEASARRAQELAESVAARELAQEALERTNDRLTFLAESAGRLLRSDAPREVLSELFAQFCQRFDIEVCFELLVDETGLPSRLVSDFGLSREERETLNDSDGAGDLIGSETLSRLPILGEDVQNSPRAADRRFREIGLAAFAAFPLVVQSRLRGVVVFATRRRERLEREELTIMGALIDLVGMALHRAHLLAELRQRAEELAEADRRKDEFLAVLAHELRNPIAAIQTALELLRVPDLASVNLRDAAAAMSRQIRHLVRLIDDLLDVARINSGRIELRKEPVDVAKAVQHAVETTGYLLDAREQEVQIQLPARNVEVLADFTRLTQVLTNLLNNAAKYSAARGKIRVRVDAEDGEVLFRVRDYGCGIPPAVLPRVFELFAQGGKAEPGLGVGLALVQRLVEMHGGAVAVSSGPQGEGSEFTVRLPEYASRRRDRDQQRRGTQDSLPRTRRPRKIVLVDDDRDVREMTRRLLELWGHRVETAEDGPAGFELILNSEPQVALIDIALPGMDGYRVARKVRETAPPLFRPRLIAMTGYGRDHDRELALASGFDFHLVKPASPEQLQRLIEDENGESNGQIE